MSANRTSSQIALPVGLTMPGSTDKGEESDADERRLKLLLATVTDPLDARAPCIDAILSLCAKFVLVPRHSKGIQPCIVLRAVLNFFIRPTSVDGLVAVKDHLSTCRCNLADPFIRGLHLSSDGSYGNMILSLASVLSAAFVDLPPGRFRTAIKTRDAGSQPWPISEADLFGGRASRDILAALMRWVEDIPSGAGGFNVIGDFLPRSPSFKAAFFANPRVLRLAIEHLKFVLRTSEAFPPQYIFPFTAIGWLFDAMTITRPLSLFLDMLDPLFDECLSMAPGLRRLARQTACPTSLDGFYRLLALKTSSRSGILRDFFSDDRIHQVAMSMMGYFRIHRRCMNIGCPAPSGNKTFQCTRCTVVRYCGAECQRNAWRDPVLPHKALCTAVQSLRRALNLEDQASWNEWSTGSPEQLMKKTSELADLCASRRVEFTLSRTIQETLSELLEKLDF